MVLPRMHLPQQPRHPRPVGPHQHEQVARVEAQLGQPGDDLHMGQLLPVGADLVLAFDDEDAVVAQHPPRLRRRREVEVQHRLVPAPAARGRPSAARGVVVPRPAWLPSPPRVSAFGRSSPSI